MSPLARPLLVFVLSCLASAASAQGTEHYNDIIVGARAASLGGAFTAIADDSTAAFHNPAGLAHAPVQGLSLSVSAYGFQRSIYTDVFSSEETTVDLTLDSLLFYPGATAYVLPLSEEDADVHHTLAFSIIAPRFSDIEGVQHLHLDDAGIGFDVFQSRVQRMLQAGPSYALRTGRVAFGASLFVQYGTFNEKFSTAGGIFSANDDGSEGAYRLLDFQFSTGTYFGLTGSLGALFELTENSRLGVTVQFPSLRLAGTARTYFAEASSTVSLNPDGSVADASLYQDVFRELKGDTNLRTPWTFSVGFAQRFGDHLLSADVDVHLPIGAFNFVSGVDPDIVRTPAELPGLDDDRGFEGRVREPKRNLVVNGAIGLQIQASPSIAVLSGLYTDFSSIPESALDAYPRIHMFGASFGIQHTGRRSKLIVGLTARYGQGENLGTTIQSDFNVTESARDARRWSISLIVGGSRALSEDDEDEDEESESDDAPEEENADEDEDRNGNEEEAPAADGEDALASSTPIRAW